jgi:hypothetical protein
MKIKTADFINLNGVGTIRPGSSISSENLIKMKIEKVAPEVLKFGADPEGEMLLGNSCVNANEHLLPEHNSLDTQIGRDGCARTLEFRPSPMPSGEELADEMYRLFREFKTNYPNYGISVKGDTQAIGCHLHVGTGFQTVCPEGLVEMYYHFLELPLWGINGTARGCYSTHRSIRIQPHGFEYRSLPAGILANKNVAKIVMKIFANITKTFIQNNELEFSTPVTDADYRCIAGLTDSEIIQFKEFCVSGVPSGNILAYWIEDNQIVIENCGTISFRDDWDQTVKDRIQADITDYMKKKGNKLRVVFFGLNNSRGAVATIPMGQTIPIRRLTSVERKEMHFVEVIGDQLLIGLPFKLRMNTEGFSDLWLEKALTYIKYKIKLEGDKAGLTRIGQSDSTSVEDVENFPRTV